MKPGILVITPIRHIDGVSAILEKAGRVTYLDDPSEAQVLERIGKFEAIFTNPNKSNVYLSKKVLDAAKALKAICTASTGTNHIDLEYAHAKNIKVLSLTEERETINKISSTAEHAFALMMASLRKIPQGWDSVKRGEWDYEPFIGRQVSELTVGVIGYGRLGKLFAGYARAFGARVLAYDPYKTIYDAGIEQAERNAALSLSDVISFHVHVTPETLEMVDTGWFSKMKPDVLLVNTARGDIMKESDLLSFLDKNLRAFYATDVLADETRSKGSSPVLKSALTSKQILITPHVGGMTREGQKIAYQRAAVMLEEYLSGSKR